MPALFKDKEASIASNQSFIFQFSFGLLIFMSSVIRRNIPKMVQMHYVDGYDKFCEFFKTFDSQGELVHVLFSSANLPNGDTWCTYCKRAWPVIEKEIQNANPNSHFVKVTVGDQPTWKNPECPFRTDPKTKLRVLPTLVRWGSPQRLEGEQCDKADLVNMLLNDEED